PRLAPVIASRRAVSLRRALRSGDLSAARGLAPADAALLEDLAQWRKLAKQDAPSFATLTEFLRRRPDWPGATRLRAKAERAMPADLSDPAGLDFFAGREPATARGARRYGEALIATGRAALGERWIVRGWRDMSAAQAEEKTYLARHAALLTPHGEARFERLVWTRAVSAARRQAARLKGGRRALVDARAALLARKRGVDRLIKRVPKSLSDHPSLLQARVRWRVRKGRYADAEAALRAADAAGALGAPAAWGRDRLVLSREALEDGRPEDAHAIAAGHGLRFGADFAALEWFAGWVALERLDQPEAAAQRFETMWRAVMTPISRSRAAYWAGAAAAADGDAAAAAAWRAKAAAYSNAYYGQLAADALGAPLAFSGPPAAAGAPRPAWSEAQRDLARAAELLYAAGAASDARRFLTGLARLQSGAAALDAVATIAAANGDARGRVKIGEIAYQKGVRLWDALYPTPSLAAFQQVAGADLEPELLLAIARQESRFDQTAVSSAGARGLVQLMPATARAMARRVGARYSKARLTSDPGYNLRLGAAFLKGLLESYRGSYILSIAAYNAGPGNVRAWIARFGDPRDPDVDPVAWVETIPFKETRNYVQRVLENVQVYRARLGGGAGARSLSADLARGRAGGGDPTAVRPRAAASSFGR
ncbi:MAG: lytic transglycosylase domain-containing protein, partial [Pseudomonadota bacterium]